MNVCTLPSMGDRVVRRHRASHRAIEEPSSASIGIPLRISQPLLRLRLRNMRRQRAALALGPADTALRRSLAALKQAENEFASLAIRTDALYRARIEAMGDSDALGRDILVIWKERAQRKALLTAKAECVQVCATRCEDARQHQALLRRQYREADRRHERLRVGLERLAQAPHE